MRRRTVEIRLSAPHQSKKRVRRLQGAWLFIHFLHSQLPVFSVFRTNDRSRFSTFTLWQNVFSGMDVKIRFPACIFQKSEISRPITHPPSSPLLDHKVCPRTLKLLKYFNHQTIHWDAHPTNLREEIKNGRQFPKSTAIILKDPKKKRALFSSIINDWFHFQIDFAISNFASKFCTKNEKTREIFPTWFIIFFCYPQTSSRSSNRWISNSSTAAQRRFRYHLEGLE